MGFFLLLAKLYFHVLKEENDRKNGPINALKIRAGKFRFSQSTIVTKDLGGKVVIPVFSPPLLGAFPLVGCKITKRTRGRGKGGEADTRALLQE